MKYAHPRVVDIELLPPYTDALMPGPFLRDSGPTFTDQWC
jgi:hypothetical protein